MFVQDSEILIAALYDPTPTLQRGKHTNVNCSAGDRCWCLALCLQMADVYQQEEAVKVHVVIKVRNTQP